MDSPDIEKIFAILEREKVDEMVSLLKDIETNDTNYDIRERLVWQLLSLAKQMDYSCGVRFDPEDMEDYITRSCSDVWPVVCIELPDVGEVAWHMPPCNIKYDGHSTEEKYQRTKKWISLQ